MSPRLIRRIVLVVFVAGIGGMIAGSIKDSNGFALAAGVITALAALGLILITAVAPPGSLDPSVDTPSPVDELVAADVEDRIQRLVAAGADEEQVRQLVRRSMDLS